MSSTAVPPKMKALCLTSWLGQFSAEAEDYSEHFKVQEVDVPKPKSGEVLVKVERSPINPSDLGCLKGSYDSTSNEGLPLIPGFEGSGTVVANGGGLLGWSLQGKRVAFVGGKGVHAWSQYVVASATQCVDLPADVSFETGASAFVNPLTVLAFLEIAKAAGQKYIVHTAAASALGKMLIRAAKTEGIGIIGTVRREEQVEELKALGAVATFNTSNKGWEKDFKKLCQDLRCKLAFDAVAGDLTGQILHNMPRGSIVKVYGGLADAAVKIRPSDFIFEEKKVEGFWLTPYIKRKNVVGLLLWMRKLKSQLSTTLKSDVSACYPLERFGEALAAYVGNMSRGKVLFAPQWDADEESAGLKEKTTNDKDAGSSSSSSSSAAQVPEKEEDDSDKGKGKTEEQGDAEEKEEAQTEEKEEKQEQQQE
ncbi:NADH oxidase [Balamuthia mandrillaris]